MYSAAAIFHNQSDMTAFTTSAPELGVTWTINMNMAVTHMLNGATYKALLSS